MKANEIRALATDFRAKCKAKVVSDTQAISIMQAMMLAEIAGQLADLNLNLEKNRWSDLEGGVPR